MIHPLVVLSPEPAAPSETFIRAHIQRLPFEIIPLYRWRAPYQAPQGFIAQYPGYLHALTDRLHVPILPNLFSRLATHQTAQWLDSVHPIAVLAEYGPLGVNILPACERSQIPLVVFFHGFDAYQQATLKSYANGYKKLFSKAAALVVPSNSMRQQLIGLGAPESLIVVNPYGVDPSIFVECKPGLNKPLFLSVGRFVGKKAPDLTIQAFHLVHKLVPSSRLVMIGAGPLLGPCKSLAESLGLAHVVLFRGACSHSEVQVEMMKTRAVVQHSIRCPSGDQEGTPVALIEAQMSGLPVVATRHAGIPDAVIHGVTGWLVDEGDIHGMAKAMIHLASEPMAAAQLGAAARSHALSSYSIDRHIEDLAKTIIKTARVNA